MRVKHALLRGLAACVALACAAAVAQTRRSRAGARPPAP